MNKVSGIIRTHLTDKWSWIMLPWLILSISFATNFVIGLSGDEIYTGGISSIFVYMLVLGIISVGQTFPFLIGFGARRKDYFIGTSSTIAIVSAASALVLYLLRGLEKWTGNWGTKLHFFNLPFLSDGPAILAILLLFSLMIHCFFAGFFVSSIHRRFGRNGVIGFFVLLSVVMTLTVYVVSSYDGWESFFDWVKGITSAGLSAGLFLMAIAYAGISYLLLRKAKG